MSDDLLIRPLNASDPERISSAFAAQSWDKPATLYQRYLQEQADGARAVLVAEVDGEFAGYVTLVWQSDYPAFRERNIPEIVDLNVLKLYQRRGVATALLAAAEKLAARKSLTVGIGFGLTGDYGPAQRLYVKRGYVPDGRGIFQGGRYPVHSDTLHADDDLALYLTRDLATPDAQEEGAETAAHTDPDFQKKLKVVQEILENL